MSDKPTREVDQLEVIRQMLERSASQQELLNAKVDAQRAENEARGTRLEANIDMLHGEFRVLADRVDVLETRVKHVRERGDEVARQSSSVDLEHEAAIGGAINHIADVDRRTADMADDLDAVKVAQAAHGEALQLVVRELGVEANLPTPTGSLPPPSLKPRRAVKPALGALKTQGNATRAAALATFVAVVIFKLFELWSAKVTPTAPPPVSPTTQHP